MMQPRRVASIYTRNVPRDTRDQFKAWCARRGYTMEKAIAALLKKAVLEDKPLPEARK